MLSATLAATTAFRAPSFSVACSLSSSVSCSWPLEAHRRARHIRALDDASWRDEEDWALLDATPEFTVGEGNTASTFWTALTSSSTVLCQRSPTECAQRVELLATQQNSTFSYGQEPRVLDSWVRLPDGRFTGRLDSCTVWLTVEAEGRLKSDPRSEPGYIETIGGRVYELGEPAAGSTASALEATGRLGVVRRPQVSPQAERRSPLQEIVEAAVVPFGRAPLGGDALKLLLSFVLVGGLCFELGAARVLSEAGHPAPLAASSRGALPTPPSPPMRSYPAAERVSLTVSEQRARQALRVKADQNSLDKLRNEAKSYEPGGIKSYETRLAALEKQLETDRERGADPERIARDKDAVDNFGPRMQREVDSVRRAISNMELKLLQDEEGLVELRRVETERGPGATAVQLGVFPTSAVDPITAGTIPSVRVAGGSLPTPMR